MTSGYCWNNQSADFVLHRACLRLKSIFWSIIAMTIFSKFLFSYNPKEHLTQLVSRNLFWSFLWHLFWRLPVKGYFCNSKGRIKWNWKTVNENCSNGNYIWIAQNMKHDIDSKYAPIDDHWQAFNCFNTSLALKSTFPHIKNSKSKIE